MTKRFTPLKIIGIQRQKEDIPNASAGIAAKEAPLGRATVQIRFVHVHLFGA